MQNEFVTFDALEYPGKPAGPLPGLSPEFVHLYEWSLSLRDEKATNEKHRNRSDLWTPLTVEPWTLWQEISAVPNKYVSLDIETNGQYQQMELQADLLASYVRKAQGGKRTGQKVAMYNIGPRYAQDIRPADGVYSDSYFMRWFATAKLYQPVIDVCDFCVVSMYIGQFPADRLDKWKLANQMRVQCCRQLYGPDKPIFVNLSPHNFTNNWALVSAETYQTMIQTARDDFRADGIVHWHAVTSQSQTQWPEVIQSGIRDVIISEAAKPPSAYRPGYEPAPIPDDVSFMGTQCAE